MESREELEQLKTKIAKLETDNGRLWYLVRAYLTERSPRGIKLNKKAWITILTGLVINIVSTVLKIMPDEIFF